MAPTVAFTLLGQDTGFGSIVTDQLMAACSALLGGTASAWHAHECPTFKPGRSLLVKPPAMHCGCTGVGLQVLLESFNQN
jgi:hypothetical protein